MTATLETAPTPATPPTTGHPERTTPSVDLVAGIAPVAGDPSAATRPTSSTTTPVDAARLRAAKVAYTTRHLAARLAEDAEDLHLLAGADVAPRAGDVVLARVVSMGHHKKVPGAGGRRQTLYPGDEVLVAYGDRYAPDQFEAVVPGSLAHTHLAAAGGLAADVVERHGRTEAPTVLEPLGLLAQADGRRITLRDVSPCAVSTEPTPTRRDTATRTVVVLGSSMNAGKTTVVANIVRGLSRAGLTVAAGKATGTGAWGDPGLFTDSGAAKVLDFTDFGYGSTFRLDLEETGHLVRSVRDELAADAPDVVVVEIADGLFQRETHHLLHDGSLADADGIVLAVGEALGAVAGVRTLREAGLPVVGVSGAVTASPLASREAAAVLDLPLVDTFTLSEPETVRALLGL